MIFNIDTFDYSIIRDTPCQKRRRGNQGKRENKRKYKDLFCAFDIESTNDQELQQAYMYIWQCQIEEYTIIGREWSEWLTFCERVCLQLQEDEYIMIYVHNLSYEFSFLKGVYGFTPEEVFCIQPRKVLKCEMMGHIEYRCSYLLTNMNLATFTKKMGVKEKLSGADYDYSKIRYPWTELTALEMEYCITDVVSLVQALKVYFKIENDNFYTIPLTSTGFVRRDVKEAMRHFNRGELKNMLPDFDIYTLLKQAFRGGNTHANRYYAEEILEDVSSYDRVSSYPDVQINELFPMSAWIREDDINIERACRKIFKQKRACLMRISFKNIRLRDPMDGCPYIPKHKCRNLTHHYNDNGRILWADYLEISLTDIDFRIILDQYIFDAAAIHDFYHCRYGRLPKSLRDVISKYYQDKTELKNVSGQELYYMMSKAKLNSIYGMSVQDICKRNILYENDQFKFDQELSDLDLYNKTIQKAFICYAWGVWTTARAREQLQIAINMTGDNFVYCDTDSVKFINDGTVDFTKYNKSRKQDSIKNGGVATDRTGKEYYLGLYDYEGTYKRFITMGAKKYAYEDSDGQLHITVAGCGKSKGAKELAERGGLEAFQEGFTFYKAGGTESVYNDIRDPFKVNIDGHSLLISSNVMIKESTYTLGVTGEYKRILSHPAIWLDLMLDSMVQ